MLVVECITDSDTFTRPLSDLWPLIPLKMLFLLFSSNVRSVHWNFSPTKWLNNRLLCRSRHSSFALATNAHTAPLSRRPIQLVVIRLWVLNFKCHRRTFQPNITASIYHLFHSSIHFNQSHSHHTRIVRVCTLRLTGAVFHIRSSLLAAHWHLHPFSFAPGRFLLLPFCSKSTSSLSIDVASPTPSFFKDSS